MGIISGGNVIEGSGLGRGLTLDGVPVDGVNEIQTITGAATGGTFTLSYRGQVTAPIARNASAATVQAALRALPEIGADGVTCTGGALGTNPVVVTFGGALAGANVPAITVDNTLATGGVVSIAQTTAGVAGSYRGCALGARLTNRLTGKVYVNGGSALRPVWTLLGNQES